MFRQVDLPNSIAGPFGPAQLRIVIPKIWTQKKSRAFGIYWSPKSNHGMLYPSPTENELSSFYSGEHYGRYLSGERAHSDKYTIVDRALIKAAYLADQGAASPTPEILKHCSAKPSICDLGCGGGTFLESIRPYTSKVVGIDPSEVSAAAVRGRGIEFHHGTADELPEAIERNDFDVVTMFHSLEHVRDVLRSLSNARSLLKPNGFVVIEVPNMGCSGFEAYPEVWFHTDAGRHLQFFTQQSLEAFCRSTGLDPFKVEFTGYTNQFLPGRLRDMLSQWDALFSTSDAPPIAPRPSFSGTLKHMARTIAATPDKKYDIVRIYARVKS